jgi:hypothetical protein
MTLPRISVSRTRDEAASSPGGDCWMPGGPGSGNAPVRSALGSMVRENELAYNVSGLCISATLNHSLLRLY